MKIKKSKTYCYTILHLLFLQDTCPDTPKPAFLKKLIFYVVETHLLDNVLIVQKFV